MAGSVRRTQQVARRLVCGAEQLQARYPRPVGSDQDAGLDFAFGLLRAVERSLWGDLLVRYITVGSDDGATLLAFMAVIRPTMVCISFQAAGASAA